VKSVRVASLFCGIGGMDLGAMGGFSFLDRDYRRLPTQVVHASDFDIKALGIYRRNFEHEPLCVDIRDMDADAVEKHDILMGGFPCQSFSVAATNPPRLGYRDVRGQLFFEMIRILRMRKPAVFIAENVKGLLSANAGAAFPLVVEEFSKVGYHVRWKVLNAAEFGVPQKRQRVFIVGFRAQSHANRFEFPDELGVSVPLKRVIEKRVDESYFFSDAAVSGMRSTKNSLAMNKGRHQDPNRPCNTVGAHLAKVSLNSTDPVYLDRGRYRMFTPREVARIQSFPEGFVLDGSKSVQYRGLGNAVPPVVMWHVVEAVLAASFPTLLDR